MRKVVKTVKASTNNITTGIVNFLLDKGHSASRVNVMGIYDEVFQQWRKSGSREGVYDIMCTLKTRFKSADGRPIGLTLAVDTKRGNDSLREEQEKFKAEVEAAGGVTFESKNYNDFVFFYNSYLEPNYL